MVYCSTILFSSDCDLADLIMLFISQLTIRDEFFFIFFFATGVPNDPSME